MVTLSDHHVCRILEDQLILQSLLLHLLSAKSVKDAASGARCGPWLCQPLVISIPVSNLSEGQEVLDQDNQYCFFFPEAVDDVVESASRFVAYDYTCWSKKPVTSVNCIFAFLTAPIGLSRCWSMNLVFSTKADLDFFIRI